MHDIKRAMSVEQAATAAGGGRTMLFEEIRKGHITARKVGRRRNLRATGPGADSPARSTGKGG